MGYRWDMILQLIERLTREASSQGLDFLLIGGQAVIHHGYVRMTLDLDLLARESQRAAWRTLLEKINYQSYAEATAFIQFVSRIPGEFPVDIMFVLDETWAKLRADAVSKSSGQVEVLIPSAPHLVALKLFATKSPTRRSPGKDWTDIEEIIRRHKLDPGDQKFADLIRRYGGEEALAKIRQMWNAGAKESKE